MHDFPSKNLTGVILAGGRATRMGGQDKGLLSLHKQPLVTYLINALRKQTADLIINANRNINIYQAFGYPVASDDWSDFFGPLAGMLAAMNMTDKPYILTAPCDSPLLPEDYALRMYKALRQQRAQISVAHDGTRLQPVFALLSTELRSSLRDYLNGGERKIDRWFARQRMAITDLSDHKTMFRNINTPEELAALEAELPRIN